MKNTRKQFSSAAINCNVMCLTVSSEWLRSTETVSPPPQYFCESKLNVWANTADIAQEACQVTKDVIGRYFEQKHRDVASQLVGM